MAFFSLSWFFCTEVRKVLTTHNVWNFWQVVDVLKVRGFFATAILRFSLFFDFPAFHDFSNFFWCSAENFTWKTYFWVFFWTNLKLEYLKIKILVITVFFLKLNFHCNLKCRSKIVYTIWENEKFFWVIFLGEKYVEKISANLGGVECTTLLTWRGITQNLFVPKNKK